MLKAPLARKHYVLFAKLDNTFPQRQCYIFKIMPKNYTRMRCYQCYFRLDIPNHGDVNSTPCSSHTATPRGGSTARWPGYPAVNLFKWTKVGDGRVIKWLIFRVIIRTMKQMLYIYCTRITFLAFELFGFFFHF